MFTISQAFIADLTSHSKDAAASGAHGPASDIQTPMNVHRGTLLFMPK